MSDGFEKRILAHSLIPRPHFSNRVLGTRLLFQDVFMSSGAHISKSDEVVTIFLHIVINFNRSCIQWCKSDVHSYSV